MVAMAKKVTPNELRPTAEHMMRPDARADKADQDSGRNHHRITENRLPRKDRHNFRDDGESRQHQDINFRVPENPKEMLPEDGRTARLCVEECGAQEALQGEHDLRGGERRKKNDHEKHGHQG